MILSTFLLAATLFVADSTPSCATDLALLERKLHLDYAGYTLELRGARLRAFAAMKAAAQLRADTTRGDACFFVLRDFVNWFDDPHLFVYERAALDSAETTRRAAHVARMAVSEPQLRAYFQRRGGSLDPIEGIWYDNGLRVAILPDSAHLPNGFVAIVLSSDTASWPVNAVRARITRAANHYDVELAERNYATVHRRANIYRHVLLRLSPGIWGKEFPVATADSGTLDPVDPHRPVLYRRNGTFVFAIPSHSGFRAVIDSLVTANHEALAHADRMIVDLRGNEGGGSQMTEGLEPFISLKVERPNPFPIEGGALLLSSDDQIAYARRAFGAETTAFVRSLVTRLRSHPGELVPLKDPASPPDAPDARNWVVATGPRAVGVLIDRGTVSASEVLVLRALRSPRATVFGEPTAGALDYQSASIVPISPREDRWYLGYGTITRRGDLPNNGMRGRGIPPEVPIDLRRVADPIAYVDQALRRSASRGTASQ
jgi:hypothetical protein